MGTSIEAATGRLIVDNSASAPQATFQGIADWAYNNIDRRVPTVTDLDAIQPKWAGMTAQVAEDNSLWIYTGSSSGWVLIGSGVVIAPSPAMISGYTLGTGHEIYKQAATVTANIWIVKSANINSLDSPGVIPAGFRPGGVVALTGTSPVAGGDEVAMQIDAAGVMRIYGAPGNGAQVLVHGSWRAVN